MIANGQLSGELICKCEKVSKWEEMIMHIFATVYTRASPNRVIFLTNQKTYYDEKSACCCKLWEKKWKKVSSRDYCINWQSSSDENMESFYVGP